MKKTLLLIIGMTSFIIYGQTPFPATTQYINTSKNYNVKTSSAQNTTIEKGNKAIYFSEDFESGVFPPAGWSTSSGPNSTITVPADQAWHESANGNPGNCASITWLNNVDVHDEWLESPTLDLSTMGTNMRLQFEFNTSQFWYVTPNDNGDIWVVISLDGGTTYTDTLFVEDDSTLLAAALVDINWLTYTWTPTRIDISAYAAETNVVFAWHYEAQDGAQYYVDNISIVDIEQNDLSLNHHWHETASLPYYQIPSTQIQPINFSAEISNLGVLNQSNTMLTVDVDGGTYTGTSATNLLTVGATDSLFVTSSYTPSATYGSHTVTWSVSSDSLENAPADNFATETLDIGFIYTRDKGIYEGEGGGEDGANAGYFMFEAGNLFDVFTTQTACKMDVVIGNNTPTETIIYGKIYELDNQGNFLYVDETPEYTITQTDVSNNANISLWLFTFPLLTAGKTYLAVVGCYSEFYYGTSGYSADQTSFIMYGGVGGTGSQYYTNETPMVRLNFDICTNVEENNPSLALSQNTPNPLNNTTSINYTLKSSGNITLSIVDMAGKEIKTVHEGNKAAGDYSIILDASELASGMYFYTLSNGESSITKTMNVTK